jgi:hypothetical protein
MIASTVGAQKVPEKGVRTALTINGEVVDLIELLIDNYYKHYHIRLSRPLAVELALKEYFLSREIDYDEAVHNLREERLQPTPA